MAATFNMKDLSSLVASRFDMTKQAGAEVTKFIFDSIKQELLRGRQVRLHHFGTLEARRRAASIACNPRTGARVKIPMRRVVKFTVSPVFKQSLLKP